MNPSTSEGNGYMDRIGKTRAVESSPEKAAGLAIATRVLTPTGWVRVGDMSVGDQVVGADGLPAQVRAVHHHGPQPAFSLSIADGAVITAAGGQPWAVEVGKGQQRRRRFLSTADIRLLRQRGITVRLVKTAPVEFRKRLTLPVQPYLLGVLLGDGCLSGKSVKLWTCEEETRAFAEAALPAGCRMSPTPTVRATTTGWPIIGVRRGAGLNPLLNGLRQMGLHRVLAHEKYVPEPYMWASVEDRLSLLQGLLDTDGASDPAGQVSFSSASERLAEDVQFLIRSLGGRCSLLHKRGITYTSPTQLTPKPARDSFKVGGIRLLDFSPFRLTRKARRVHHATKMPQWTIRRVEPYGVTDVVAVDIEDQRGAFLIDAFVPVAASSSLRMAGVA
jgi:hypothetical protein